MRGWGEEEEPEFLTFDGEKIFTQDWATNAIGLSFLNRNTQMMSDRWWQSKDAIIDKERFDEAFTVFLQTYIKIQDEELRSQFEDNNKNPLP